MFKIIKNIFFTLFIIAALAISAGYLFGVSYIPLKMHNNYYKKANVALEGYDMVYYFKKKNANRGNEIFFYRWEDSNWFFNSSGNENLFKSSPEKYAPQFGGYCSYYASKNIAYPPNPTIWYIYKGKLYLFSNEENKQTVLSDWENYIAKANENWKP